MTEVEAYSEAVADFRTKKDRVEAIVSGLTATIKALSDGRWLEATMADCVQASLQSVIVRGHCHSAEAIEAALHELQGSVVAIHKAWAAIPAKARATIKSPHELTGLAHHLFAPN